MGWLRPLIVTVGASPKNSAMRSTSSVAEVAEQMVMLLCTVPTGSVQRIAPDESRRFKSVAAGVGSEILISFYPIPWVPRRVSWLASITEFRWNSHFCDAQLRGPFTAFNHRHGIEAEFRDGQEGTLVSDVVEYALPYGFMGRIAGAMVRRQLTRSFAFRQKRLPEILAATQKQAARTA